MGELLHGVDNHGDAVDAFEGLLERLGDLGTQEGNVRVPGGGFHAGGQLRPELACRGGGGEFLLLREQTVQRGEGFRQEPEIVPYTARAY